MPDGSCTTSRDLWPRCVRVIPPHRHRGRWKKSSGTSLQFINTTYSHATPRWSVHSCLYFQRSEERRVGKEGRCVSTLYHEKKNEISDASVAHKLLRITDAIVRYGL